ncbi:hypothetical protein [Frog virus 3]|uniref:Uncharacterized protein n=2 Tax=Frog virus 3 TaxID=10493 RepID=V5N088_FRG3V|nr:unknown [Soft-shelled turtle iridovirus]AHA80938.1 hypothetical protein [Chinese giant salamander iridovirus]
MLLRVPALMVSSELGSSITAHLTPPPNLAISGLAEPAEGFLPVRVWVLIFTAKQPSIFSNRVWVTVLPLFPVPVQNSTTLSGFPPTKVAAAFLRKNLLVPSSGKTEAKNAKSLVTGPLKSLGLHEKLSTSSLPIVPADAKTSSCSKHSASLLAWSCTLSPGILLGLMTGELSGCLALGMGPNITKSTGALLDSLSSGLPSLRHPSLKS